MFKWQLLVPAFLYCLGIAFIVRYLINRSGRQGPAFSSILWVCWFTPTAAFGLGAVFFNLILFAGIWLTDQRILNSRGFGMAIPVLVVFLVTVCGAWYWRMSTKQWPLGRMPRWLLFLAQTWGLFIVCYGIDWDARRIGIWT